MNDDLISRKSVLDYIEKEIATAKCTETISYLRALSVHINEYEPTAFDVDKVVKKLKHSQYMLLEEVKNATSYSHEEELIENIRHYEYAINIVKAGGIDVESQTKK